ncbi:hypothetical protein Hanom_Chr01g00032361 [Helianthus anomalus]
MHVSGNWVEYHLIAYLPISYPFFERPTNPPNGLLAKFTASGYTRHPNRGKPSPRANACEHSPEGTTVQ